MGLSALLSRTYIICPSLYSYSQAHAYYHLRLSAHSHEHVDPINFHASISVHGSLLTLSFIIQRSALRPQAEPAASCPPIETSNHHRPHSLDGEGEAVRESLGEKNGSGSGSGVLKILDKMAV